MNGKNFSDNAEDKGKSTMSFGDFLGQKGDPEK